MRREIRTAITGGSGAGRICFLDRCTLEGKAMGAQGELLALLEPEIQGCDDHTATMRRMSNDLIREAEMGMRMGRYDSATEAIRSIGEEIECGLRKAKGDVFLSRADDIRDLTAMLIKRLCGELADQHRWDGYTVLAGEQISTLDALEAVRCGVAGVILQNCGPLSHAAIVLRQGGIPLARNVDVELLKADMPVALDGMRQCLILDAEGDDISIGEEVFIPEVPNTFVLKDGSRFHLAFNSMGSFTKLPSRAEVGLLRTELFYAALNRLPEEAELVCEYMSVAADRRATIRLLDAGGDKPIVGLTGSGRGVALLLEFPDVLSVQLRAILRAAATCDIRLLVPMVSSAEEMLKVRKRLDEVHHILQSEQMPHGKVAVGAMIENEMAMQNIEGIVEESDFLAVGTNDLTRCVGEKNTWAALKRAQKACGSHGRELCVCGELASTLEGFQKLVRLGFRNVSIQPDFLAKAVEILDCV